MKEKPELYKLECVLSTSEFTITKTDVEYEVVEDSEHTRLRLINEHRRDNILPTDLIGDIFTGDFNVTSRSVYYCYCNDDNLVEMYDKLEAHAIEQHKKEKEIVDTVQIVIDVHKFSEKMWANMPIPKRFKPKKFDK